MEDALSRAANSQEVNIPTHRDLVSASFPKLLTWQKGDEKIRKAIANLLMELRVPLSTVPATLPFWGPVRTCLG